MHNWKCVFVGGEENWRWELLHTVIQGSRLTDILPCVQHTASAVSLGIRVHWQEEREERRLTSLHPLLPRRSMFISTISFAKNWLTWPRLPQKSWRHAGLGMQPLLKSNFTIWKGTADSGGQPFTSTSVTHLALPWASSSATLSLLFSSNLVLIS